MDDGRGPGCLIVLLVIAVAIFGGLQIKRMNSDWKALQVKAESASLDAQRAHRRLQVVEARLGRLEAARRPPPAAEPAR